MKKWSSSKNDTKITAILEIIPQITEERITFKVVMYLSWTLMGHRVQQLTFEQITLFTPYLFLTLNNNFKLHYYAKT
jgi:hypothetical protein